MGLKTALRGPLALVAPVSTPPTTGIGRKFDKAGYAPEGTRIGAIRETFPHGLDPKANFVPARQTAGKPAYKGLGGCLPAR